MGVSRILLSFRPELVRGNQDNTECLAVTENEALSSGLEVDVEEVRRLGVEGELGGTPSWRRT